jgi:hypothetical protein
MKMTECHGYTLQDIKMLAASSPHGVARIGITDTKTFLSMGCVKTDSERWMPNDSRRSVDMEHSLVDYRGRRRGA